MAKCPKCGATLLEDSGLVTCHACGAIVIIDEDGNPIVDNGEPANFAASASAPIPASLRNQTFAKSNEAQSSAPLDPLEYLGGLASGPGSQANVEVNRYQSSSQQEQADAPSHDVYAAANSEQHHEFFEPAQTHPDQFVEAEDESAQPNSFHLDSSQSHATGEASSHEQDSGFPMNPDFADMGGYESTPAGDTESNSSGHGFQADHSQTVNFHERESHHSDPNSFTHDQQSAGSGDFFENGISFGTPDEGGTLSADDPLGLNAFANSEVSAANDGMLVCRIFIDGIDTKEIRANLRAAMDDQRFNWDLNEVLARLKNGQLVIEKITPVKAMVLIKRIKQMPVHIRWEQYTIAEVEEDDAQPTFDQDSQAH